MKSTVLRLEIIIASTLPAAAIFLVGMQAIKQMANTDITIFLLILFASAVGVFLGELALLRLMQRATREQFDEILLVCQEYMAGNHSRRSVLYGDNALSTLARVLNTLFESLAQGGEQSAPPENRDSAKPSQALDNQLQRLIREITPVMSGDLRVQATVHPGRVGVVADLCNALVGEIVELVQWVRYSAEHFTSKTRALLDTSIELAQAVEMQMQNFSQTTETIEKLVVFLQRLNNSLESNFELLQKVQIEMRHRSDQDADVLLQKLDRSINNQEKLLDTVVSSIPTNISLAEVMITDFYTFSKRIHESNTAILQTAEHIHSLSLLAEQWQNAVQVFQLPDTPRPGGQNLSLSHQ